MKLKRPIYLYLFLIELNIKYIKYLNPFNSSIVLSEKGIKYY